MTKGDRLASPNALGPQDLLTGTDWSALKHAYGPATEAPEMLTALLDEDQNVRTRSLDYLHGVLHHQNTLYEATAPAALYVAGVLADPRTTSTVVKDRRSFPGCMRAELLRWIGSVANEVTDEAAATCQRFGFPLDDYAPAVAIMGMRPHLFTTTFPYIKNADRHVREAALTACIPLLDDPQLLHHRPALADPLREQLGTSDLWQHRERAIDALDAWGEDSSGIERQRNPFLFCDSDLVPDKASAWLADEGPNEGYSEDPPF